MSKTDDRRSRRDFLKGTTAAAGAAVVTIGFVRPEAAAAAVDENAITQLASFKINMEKEAEAIETLEELCKGVEDSEPGVLAYICHRKTETPDTLVFFEIYKDEAAMQAHNGTPHMGKMRGAFATQFMPPLEVTRLTCIGGFSR